KYVGDHPCIVLPYEWQLFFDKCARADVLQTDRIEHPTVGLDYPARRISGERLCRQALGREPSEAIQIQQLGELQSVAECPRRPQHRVVESNSRDLYREPRIVLCLVRIH